MSSFTARYNPPSMVLVQESPVFFCPFALQFFKPHLEGSRVHTNDLAQETNRKPILVKLQKRLQLFAPRELTRRSPLEF